MAEKELQAELEQMRADMEKLRADFSGVAAALKAAGKAEAASVKEHAHELMENAEEEIKRLLCVLRDKSKQGAEAVEHKVAEHPFITLVAAFGVGFLLAKLIDRK